MLNCPEVYLSKPPMIFKRVVFPQPEAPKTDTNSLFLNSTEIPSKARTMLSPAR